MTVIEGIARLQWTSPGSAMLRPVSALQSRVWRAGQKVRENFPLDELDGLLADPECLVWLDVVHPGPDLLNKLAEELNLDPLAVEDAFEPRERPKATRHPAHTFLTCYATRLKVEEGLTVRLETPRVSAFVMANGLITVRTADHGEMDEVIQRWETDGLLEHGVSALVHGMLDTFVDGHFDAIQAMDDALDALEDQLFDETIQTRKIQQRIFGIRKALVQLRRVVLPMREVVTAVMRFRGAGGTPIARELDGYFNDLYDHVIRASEWTESLRDVVGSIFETNLSLQDARLNEVMKKLASWAAIIAVPTAVTGWFGQNIPYPGFADSFGLLLSVVTILVGTVGLYMLFRRVDWI